MTVNDPFAAYGGQNVDEYHMATAIGKLIAALHGDINATSVGREGATEPTTLSMSPTTTPATAAAATTTPITPVGSTTVDSAVANGETSNPIPSGYSISGQFGENRGGHIHEGVDLGVPVGTMLVSAISGTVTQAGNNDPGGYGNTIEITSADGHTMALYGHVSEISVELGSTVKAGQPIGKSGGEQGAPGAGNSEGPHLHFEVRQDGTPIDPMAYLAGGAQIIKPQEGAKAGAASTAASGPPPKPVDPQDAVDTAMNRVTGGLMGQDPGSANARVDPAKAATTIGAKTTGTTGTSTSGSDSDPKAIDAFLNATKQHESSGDYSARYHGDVQSDAAGAYQFISTTWKSWGGTTDSAADASPAEQDAVARRMAQALFDEFHSWRLVAIAWYGGPGVAQQAAQGVDPGSPEGQGPYLAYGDTIARMMSGG